MITVHHLENSRSQRILWLLEELGLEYKIESYQRDPITSLAPPELLAIHPLGKSPIISDDTDDTKGNIIVAESGAIVEYLVENYDNGQLLPKPGTAERRAYSYWLHYAEGTFMPYMVFSLIVQRIETAKVPFFVKPVARGIAGKVRQSYLEPNIRRNLAFLEASLSHDLWFCGSTMTAADIQMSFPVQAAKSRTNLRAEYPKLSAFLDTIEARPQYKEALERGGPFNLLR